VDGGDAGGYLVIRPAAQREYPIQEVRAVAGIDGREVLGGITDRDLIPIDYPAEPGRPEIPPSPWCLLRLACVMMTA
jgi:hypothetical protein